MRLTNKENKESTNLKIGQQKSLNLNQREKEKKKKKTTYI